MNSTLGSTGTFGLFVVVNIASWVFVRRFVPEAKGTTLEELEERFEAEGITRTPTAVGVTAPGWGQRAPTFWARPLPLADEVDETRVDHE